MTDVREIKQAYQKSKDEAKKKYGGKEVTILGNVMYVSESFPSIRIGTATDLSLASVPDIECSYAESDPMFKGLRDKQAIKVKGVLNFTDAGMEIKPCKFVPF